MVYLNYFLGLTATSIAAQQVAGIKIDEVFIGSCMIKIGHFRAAGKLRDKVEGGSRRAEHHLCVDLYA